jgi:hypothetical protein
MKPQDDWPEILTATAFALIGVAVGAITTYYSLVPPH